MKPFIQLTACLIALPLNLLAETKDVTDIRLAGPYSITKPFMTDSLDSEGKQIDLDEVFMNSPVPTSIKGEETSLPFSINDEGFYFAGFSIQNTGFAKGKVDVKCESKHKLFIDGNEQGGDFELVPGRHEVSVKILRKGDKPDTLRVSVESEQALEINPEGKRYASTRISLIKAAKRKARTSSSTSRQARSSVSMASKGGFPKATVTSAAIAKQRVQNATKRLTPRQARRHSSVNILARDTLG